MILQIERLHEEEGIFKNGLRFTWGDQIPDVSTLRFIAMHIAHGADVKEAIAQGKITPNFADPSGEAAFAYLKELERTCQAS